MERAIAEHGAPRQLISDNGIQFISRSSHKPVHFQQPQVCGCAGHELSWRMPIAPGARPLPQAQDRHRHALERAARHRDRD